MILNGHELETKYVKMIVSIKNADNNKKWFDFLWYKRTKRKLEKRLQQLKNDYNKGLISQKAYTIWEEMLKEVL